MAEETQPQQDSSKTLVSFVVGLLIGGMLVWAFSGPSDQPPEPSNDEVMTEEVMEEGEDMSEEEATDETATEEENTPVLPMGDGSIEVNDQPAGLVVELARANYPIEEGWIGVRDYDNGQLSFIKGVVRFSAAAGLVPESIPLVPNAPTLPGQDYAIVIFSENGDGTFNPAGDVQMDEIYATFTAQ